MNNSIELIDTSSRNHLLYNLYSSIGEKVKKLMMEIQELREGSGEDDLTKNEQMGSYSPYEHNVNDTLALINRFKSEDGESRSIFATAIIDETSHGSAQVEDQVAPMDISDGVDQSRSDQPQESKNIFQYRGFCALKEYLVNLKTNHPIPRIEIRSRTTFDNKDTIVTGISYFYDNNPVNGWKKELMLRMNGKTRGKLDIHYHSPDRSRKFRSRADLQSYFEKEHIPLSNLNKFSFHSVFCVCQTVENSSIDYLECSYGKCGCNTWIHPQCVGLGYRTEEELHHMDKVICPLCSVYLEGCGRKSQFENDFLMLKQLTPGFSFESVTVKNHVIEESNMPHRIWGFEGFSKSYKVPDNKMNYEIPDDLKFRKIDELNMKPQEIPFTQLRDAESNGYSNPDTLQRSSSTGNKIITLPQHSLFAAAMNPSTAIGTESNPAPTLLASTVSTTGSTLSTKLPVGKIIEVIEDEDNKIIILHENQPLDCWRRKIEYPDAESSVDGITKPKLFGLWGNFTKVQQSPEIPLSDALSLANHYHYRPPPLIKTQPVLLPVPPTDQANPIDGTAAMATTVMDDDPVLTPLDIANKVLAKVRARKEADGKCDPTPSNIMKRKILDILVNATKVTAAVQQQAQRNKKSRGGGTSTSNGNNSNNMTTTASNDFRVILGHIPMDDGGLKVVPINQNVIPTILHDLCATSLCGFCFTDLSTNTKLIPTALFSTASVTGSDGGGGGSSSSKKEKEVEESLFNVVDPNLPTTVTAGAWTVNVHGCCKRMIDQGHLLPSLSSLSPATTTTTAAGITHSLSVHSQFYAYEEAEDMKSCSLCGKSGGLLFPFDIPTMDDTDNTFATLLTLTDTGDEENEMEKEEVKVVKKQPAGEQDETNHDHNSQGKKNEDGKRKATVKHDWVGHIPCLQYLHLSQSLNLPSFHYQQYTLQQQQHHKLSKKQSFQPAAAVQNSVPVVCQESMIGTSSSSSILQEEEDGQDKTSEHVQDHDKEEAVPMDGIQPDTNTTSMMESAAPPSNNVLVPHCTRPTSASSDEVTRNTLFEDVCHQYRCMLCGMKTGIVLRCLSIGCAVRAHPICVNFMKSWSMTKVTYAFPCHTAAVSASSSTCTCPVACNNSMGSEEENVESTSCGEHNTSIEKESNVPKQVKMKKKMHSIASIGFLCAVHKPKQ